MEHYCNDIYGWFDFYQIYHDAVNNAKGGEHFVEIGCWNGKSSTYMGVEILNSGKNIKFECIDSWKGDRDTKKYNLDAEQAFEEFKKNTKPISSILTYRRMLSLDAAKTYEDNSLDFVFIDGSHDYENVLDDLKAWIRTIKIGGILSGHDYGHGPVQKALKDFGILSEVEIVHRSWRYKVEA